MGKCFNKSIFFNQKATSLYHTLLSTCTNMYVARLCLFFEDYTLENGENITCHLLGWFCTTKLWNWMRCWSLDERYSHANNENWHDKKQEEHLSTAPKALHYTWCNNVHPWKCLCDKFIVEVVMDWVHQSLFSLHTMPSSNINRPHTKAREIWVNMSLDHAKWKCHHHMTFFFLSETKRISNFFCLWRFKNRNLCWNSIKCYSLMIYLFYLSLFLFKGIFLFP